MNTKDWTPAELFTDGRSGKWVDDDGVVHRHGGRPDNRVAEELTERLHPHASQGRSVLTNWTLSPSEKARVDAWLAEGSIRPPQPKRRSIFSPPEHTNPFLHFMHRIGLYP